MKENKKHLGANTLTEDRSHWGQGDLSKTPLRAKPNARRIFHFHSGGFEASPGYSVRTCSKEPLPGLHPLPVPRGVTSSTAAGRVGSRRLGCLRRRPAGLILTPDPFRTAVSQPQAACSPRLPRNSAVTGPADAGAGRRADVHRGSVRAASVRVRGLRGRGLGHGGRGLETSVSLGCLFVSRAVLAWSSHAATLRIFLLRPARPAVTASSRLPTLLPEVTGPGPSRLEAKSWIPRLWSVRLPAAPFRAVPPEPPWALCRSMNPTGRRCSPTMLAQSTLVFPSLMYLLECCVVTAPLKAGSLSCGTTAWP